MIRGIGTKVLGKLMQQDVSYIKPLCKTYIKFFENQFQVIPVI